MKAKKFTRLIRRTPNHAIQACLERYPPTKNAPRGAIRLIGAEPVAGPMPDLSGEVGSEWMNAWTLAEHIRHVMRQCPGVLVPRIQKI